MVATSDGRLYYQEKKHGLVSTSLKKVCSVQRTSKKKRILDVRLSPYHYQYCYFYYWEFCIWSLWPSSIIIPAFAVAIRRLHDTGRSGWWLLVNCVPIIGWTILFIWLVKDSDEGENQYGPNPKDRKSVV